MGMTVHTQDASSLRITRQLVSSISSPSAWMPAPSTDSEWLSSRKFGIVIDAGSSGSRLQIYSWKNPVSALAKGGDAVAYTLPKVEKGVRKGEEWVKKAEPGLSSFHDKLDDISGYLAPLLEHARSQIPPSLHHDTPLFLLATAGMRLLPANEQAKVLQATCQFLKFHSNFKIDEPSNEGPCGSSVRIITGEEEGLFGWIAVNYLMDGFNNRTNEPTTYGFLDMGGASTQIAFEPHKQHRSNVNDSLVDVRLRLLGGKEIHHQVFVTTWLGYGTNQARERYVGETIKHAEVHHDHTEHTEHIPDPCLPKDLELLEHPVFINTESNSHVRKAHKLLGTGSFEKCLKATAPLLNKTVPCKDAPCLFNGVHVPQIDFAVSKFIGVSEYWYSSEHVFGLGGAYDYVSYERAASEFCARPWNSIKEEHDESREHGLLGGDGEVVKGGKVVSVGKWGAEVEIARLQMQCFKAAWVANVLHEGIGMPRIVDSHGNKTSNEINKIADQADRKGLGRPTFQSIDSVGDIAISWTLGKMVLEASRGVPIKANDRPLTDPLDDIPVDTNSPIQPIRFPFLRLDSLDQHIDSHLPVALNRESLGFSSVVAFFYLVLFAIVGSLCWRRRHRICQTRRPGRRDRDSYALEEGKLHNGSAPPSPNSMTSITAFLKPLRRLTSQLSTSSDSPYSRPTLRAEPAIAHVSSRPDLRHANSTSSNLTTLTRSNSTPPVSFTTGERISRSSTPSNADSNLLGGLSSLSRSRNTSQISLSGLATRVGPRGSMNGTKGNYLTDE